MAFSRATVAPLAAPIHINPQTVVMTTAAGKAYHLAQGYRILGNVGDLTYMQPPRPQASVTA